MTVLPTLDSLTQPDTAPLTFVNPYGLLNPALLLYQEPMLLFWLSPYMDAKYAAIGSS